MNKYLVKTEQTKEQKEKFREIPIEDIHTHNVHILTLSGNRRLITCKIPEKQKEDLNCMAVE